MRHYLNNSMTHFGNMAYLDGIWPARNRVKIINSNRYPEMLNDLAQSGVEFACKRNRFVWFANRADLIMFILKWHGEIEYE